MEQGKKRNTTPHHTTPHDLQVCEVECQPAPLSQHHSNAPGANSVGIHRNVLRADPGRYLLTCPRPRLGRLAPTALILPYGFPAPRIPKCGRRHRPPPPSHPTGHRHGSNVPGATPQRVPGAAARQDATATLMVLGVVVVAFLWLTFLPFNVQHALAFLGVYGLRHPRPRPWAGMASEVRGPGSQGTSFFLNQYYFNTVHCLVGIKFEFQLQTQKSRILLLNIVFSHIHLIQPYF